VSLAPSAAFTLGDLRYETHAAALTVTLALLPGVDGFRVTLAARADVRCTAGDRAVLDLDGGEGRVTVVTGKVRGVQRSLDAIEVWAADAGADLAAVRPAATYTGQAAADVIAALAGDAGVSVGARDIDVPLAAYAAHQGRTAAEHVAYLARLGGAVAAVDGDGTLTLRRRPTGPADAALLHGRELVSYRTRDWSGSSVRQVVIGNGPAGTTEAPDALRPTVERLPGDAPAPGAGAVWQAAAVLRTPGAATAATQAADIAAAAGARRLRALCFLVPALRPGMTVEIQSLPDGLDRGPWLLTRVTHRVPASGPGTTLLEAETASAGPGDGLLGAALAAVGNLL
jgi:prophage tail gpP-like protein